MRVGVAISFGGLVVLLSCSGDDTSGGGAHDASGGTGASAGNGATGAEGGVGASGGTEGSAGTTGGTAGSAGASGGTAGASGAAGSSGASGGGAGGAPTTCIPKASGYVTDLGAHPEPALPSLPNAGASVQDPTFGTTIVRITDSGDGSDCTTAYSYWPSFNADSTRLHMSCSSGTLLFDFAPATAQASNRRPLFAKPTPNGTTPNWEDAIWSDVDPDLLFAHDTQRLWKYDVAGESYTLVKDFSSVLGSGHVRQMSKSANDDVFGFTTQDASFAATGGLAYRASDDAVLVQLSQAGLDEVQVDKTGGWLVLKTGNQGAGAIEVKVANLGTQAVEDLSDDGPDFAPGHSDNGAGIVVGADNWNNHVTFRRLSTPHAHTTVLDLASDWGQDFHVSMHASDDAWALLSLYESGAHTPGLFHDEIVQVKTDGSQEVRRLAHHHSQFSDYWDSPRGNVSRDGCFIAFTSTWGPSGRRDVFVLDLSK